MKKSLLLLCGAMMATSSAIATELSPEEIDDLVITAVSPNGEWAVSSDADYFNLTVLNLVTGQIWGYGEAYGTNDTYVGGMGCYVSNDGTVVASDNSDVAYFWKDGVWTPLPVKITDFGSYPNAITLDGRFIVGSVSRTVISVDADDVMTVPAIWARNDEGTYDMYETLPYPNTDWTGRKPQYILIDDVSADGTVLAGMMTDYSGFTQEPLIISKQNDGTWAYELLHHELINPTGVELPPYPGEGTAKPDEKLYMTEEEYAEYEQALDDYWMRPYPSATDFMSEAEYAAYEAAYEAYMNNEGDYPDFYDYMTEEEIQAYQDAIEAYYAVPYPQAVDFMTEAEKAAYDADYEIWSIENDEWMEAYNNFDNMYWAVAGDAVGFTMNSARISPNGRYYLISAENEVEDPDSWFGFRSVSVPYVFDLYTNDYAVMSEGQEDVLATMVTDDAYVLGASPAADYTRDAFMAKGFGEPFVSLKDLIAEKDPALGEWIEEHTTHTVYDYDWEYDPDIDDYVMVTTEKEISAMGTPVADAELSLFATWVSNNWDFAGAYYYSYIMPVKGKFSGVESIAAKAATFDVKVDRTGVINIYGNAANVAIYDIDGRIVYSVDAPGSQVVAKLAKGAYVVKATAADGTVISRKAIF